MVSTLDIDIFVVTIWQDFSQTKFLKTDRPTYTKKTQNKYKTDQTSTTSDWQFLKQKKNYE